MGGSKKGADGAPQPWFFSSALPSRTAVVSLRLDHGSRCGVVRRAGSSRPPKTGVVVRSADAVRGPAPAEQLRFAPSRPRSPRTGLIHRKAGRSGRRIIVVGLNHVVGNTYPHWHGCCADLGDRAVLFGSGGQSW